MPKFLLTHHAGHAVYVVTAHRRWHVLDGQTPLAEDVMRYGATPRSTEGALGINREFVICRRDRPNPSQVRWYSAFVPAEGELPTPTSEMSVEYFAQNWFAELGDVWRQPRCNGYEGGVPAAFLDGPEDSNYAESCSFERYSKRVASAGKVMLF